MPTGYGVSTMISKAFSFEREREREREREN
jgi:hypothetical protein